MKTIRLIFASLASLAITLSCSHKEEQAPTPINEHNFTVEAELPGMEQEPDSKGYLGSYISASWNKGDKVSVVNLTKGKILGGSLTADRSGNKTTFSGTVSGTIATGDIISLVHPAFGTESETDFGTRTINLSAQSKAANVPLVAYGTFTASDVNGTFAGLNLDFYYVLSYMKINMANLPAEATISKIQLRNMPAKFSLTINAGKTGFDAGTAAEKSAKGLIEITGPFTTSTSGALMMAIGVMPSEEANDRNIFLTAEGDGDYVSPLSSAELSSHKYYNTIASQFEKIGLPGQKGYGIYDMTESSAISSYEEFTSTVISGLENNESDFTLLNTSTFEYWTIKGIPADCFEGETITARVYTYGIDFPTHSSFENAVIKHIETDGGYTKLWIKAGDKVFIVRK